MAPNLKKCQCLELHGSNSPDCEGYFIADSPAKNRQKYCLPCSNWCNLKNARKAAKKNYSTWKKREAKRPRCSVEGCSNPRAHGHKYLCLKCWHNPDEVLEIPIKLGITSSVRKRLTGTINKYANEARERGLTVYSSDQYPQEFLQQLVEECR